MTIIVTGGAGFIGSNIVVRLRSEGTDSSIVVLDDLSTGYRQNIEFVDVDLQVMSVDDRQVGKVFERGADIVFHLAASVGNKRSIEHPRYDATVNVLGTINVLEAARIAGAHKVVISSSAGIFGELKTLPICEDHPLEPDTPYGCTKLCEEKLGLAYAKLYGLEVICLRYFNVYGPNQHFDAYGNVIPIFAFKMLKGEPITIFGDGEQTRDFISVHDVVQANIKASQASGVSGAFNIGSGSRISINSLVELLAEVSGITPEVVYEPKRPGDVLDSLADIDLARVKLGFEPSVDLREGLKEYMDWARREISR